MEALTEDFAQHEDDDGPEVVVGADGDTCEWAKSNAVMVLHQHCQRNSLSLDYKYVEDGKPHAKIYKVCLGWNRGIGMYLGVDIDRHGHRLGMNKLPALHTFYD